MRIITEHKQGEPYPTERAILEDRDYQQMVEANKNKQYVPEFTASYYDLNFQDKHLLEERG